MDDQRLGVADVGEERVQLEGVDEALALLDAAALDAEADQGAVQAVVKVFAGQRVGRVVGEFCSRLADGPAETERP